MRLALEAAIRSADADTLVRWTPTLMKVRGDGRLATATWTGPRDNGSSR